MDYAPGVLTAPLEAVIHTTVRYYRSVYLPIICYVPKLVYSARRAGPTGSGTSVR
jgi:hypothetical protein